MRVERRQPRVVADDVVPERHAELRGESGFTGADRVQELRERKLRATERTVEIEPVAQATRMVGSQDLAQLGHRVCTVVITREHADLREEAQQPVERVRIDTGRCGPVGQAQRGRNPDRHRGQEVGQKEHAAHRIQRHDDHPCAKLTNMSERREPGIPASSERGPSGPARRAKSGQT